MRRTKYYEILILITYLAMSVVCIYLQFFSKGQAGSVSNLIVNVSMLIISGVIFASCVFGSLLPTASITADLLSAGEKFEEDAKTAHNYLWSKYVKDKDEIFHDNRLLKQFKDYKLELDRISKSGSSFYQTDIEEYIGYDLMDRVIHSNVLSQVPGVMTGLGILGTFIGLSLGLQGFNTGTTAEITGSIEPLMNGIKVAFHTSIYGMVFSLVFNYVYKKRLDDAENALNYFLRNFKKYVLPDTEKESANMQTRAIIELNNTISQRLPGALKEFFEPQFEHFDETLDHFSRMATRNQMEQLSRVVDKFLEEMDTSMSDSFSNLSKTVSQSMYLQEANNEQIKKIVINNAVSAEGMAKAAEDMASVSENLKNITESLGRCIDDIKVLEAQASKQAEAIKVQNESNRKIQKELSQYMDALDNAARRK
jgi:biopolymer transport protein ExbB/TolQ